MLPILHLSKGPKTSPRNFTTVLTDPQPPNLANWYVLSITQTQPQTRQGNTNAPWIQLVITQRPTGSHQPVSNFITFPCLLHNHRKLFATTSRRMMWAKCCPKARDGVHQNTDTQGYDKIPSKQPFSIFFSVGLFWLIFLNNPAHIDSEQLCGY